MQVNAQKVTAIINIHYTSYRNSLFLNKKFILKN